MDAPRFSAQVGTEAEGRAMIGTSAPVRRGGVPVNEGMIRLLCSSIKDGNPRYWEQGEAPPAMLLSWLLDLPWAPDMPASRRILSGAVPLPGDQLVNAGQHVEFHEKILVGDQLSMLETLIEISDEKTTHLGIGHFVKTRMDVTRQDGTLVATITNNLFRYRTK
jgi:uncharacterized protein